MKLEEAKERCNELIKEKHANWIGLTSQEAISTVLQEIEHLQKENEELKTFLKRIEDKDLDEANIRAEAMLDMDKIWRNKIREKIEEYRNKEYITEMCALKDLLKEE